MNVAYLYSKDAQLLFKYSQQPPVIRQICTSQQISLRKPTTKPATKNTYTKLYVQQLRNWIHSEVSKCQTSDQRQKTEQMTARSFFLSKQVWDDLLIQVRKKKTTKINCKIFEGESNLLNTIVWKQELILFFKPSKQHEPNM